jgi:hypothetical protein
MHAYVYFYMSVHAQQALKRVRSADYTKKIALVLVAADEDSIGKHAPDARARLTDAAATATAASEAVKRGADDLEVRNTATTTFTITPLCVCTSGVQ